MQIVPANDPTSQATLNKGGSAPMATDSASEFPSSLLAALLFSPQKNPPGPEPPFPSTPKVGAEEAAKAPNAPTQKLDSPHRDPKVTIPVTPDLAQLTAAQALQVSVAGAEAKDAKVERSKESSLNGNQASTKEISPPGAGRAAATSGKELPVSGKHDQVKSASDAKTAMVLPKDAAAPIVSVKRIAETTGQQQDASVRPSEVKPASQPKAAAGSQGSDIASIQSAASGSKHGASFGDGSRQRNNGQRSATPPSGSVTSVSAKASGSGQIEKPAEITANQGLDRAALVRQVADKLQALAASRSKEGVVVQLAPKALGSITLTLKNLGSGMEAHIAASDEHVRKALEQSRPDLIQSMQTRGYQVSSVTVSAQTSGSTDGSHHPQGFQPRPQNSAPNDPTTQRPNDQPTDQATNLPRPLSGVDISI